MKYRSSKRLNQICKSSFSPWHRINPQFNFKLEFKLNFMDFSYLLAISDGDQEFIKEFVETFERNSNNILNSLMTALENNDLDSQKKLAHQIKPSLEMLGLPSFQTSKDIQNDPTAVPKQKFLEMIEECNAAVVEMKKEFNL